MPKGESNRKITPEQTAYIRQQVAKGRCQSALARKFGISRQRVNQIKIIERDGLDFIAAVRYLAG